MTKRKQQQKQHVVFSARILQCVKGCPVNINIPGFISELVKGNVEGAYQGNQLSIQHITGCMWSCMSTGEPV